METLIVKAYEEKNTNKVRIGVFDKKGNLIQRSKITYSDNNEEEDAILKQTILKLAELLRTKYGSKTTIIEHSEATPYILKMKAAKLREAEEKNARECEELLEANPEYIKKTKKTKLQRKTLGVVALGLVGVIGLTSCAYALGRKTSSKKDATKLAAVPTATVSVTTTPMPSMTPSPVPTPTPEREYTTEEKIAFINEHVEEFKEKYNAIVGREIDSNQALLQLAYINGLSKSQVGFDSNDYILDFLTDYGAYWDAMTTQTKNNIAVNVVDTAKDEIIKYEDIDLEKLTDEEKACLESLFKPIPLKGQNPFINGELYGEYILDNEDKKAYVELAAQIQNIVTLAYEGLPGKATAYSYQANKYAAERYVFDNNVDIDFNYQNLSESTKLMNHVMIAHITHFLPEKTEFNVDTLVGEEKMINYDHKKEVASFDENAMSYTITNNLYYDNDYYFQWLTITETRKALDDAERCIVPEETPKVKTKSR